MNCEECGKELADNAKFCDGCGTQVLDLNDKIKILVDRLTDIEVYYDEKIEKLENTIQVMTEKADNNLINSFLDLGELGGLLYNLSLDMIDSDDFDGEDDAVVLSDKIRSIACENIFKVNEYLNEFIGNDISENDRIIINRMRKYYGNDNLFHAKLFNDNEIPDCLKR